jgi:hypothetical protein
MELNQQLGLPPVLRAETSAAENKHQWVLSLQLRKLAALREVVGKLVVGKHRSWNNVRSHRKSSTLGCSPPF